MRSISVFFLMLCISFLNGCGGGGGSEAGPLSTEKELDRPDPASIVFPADSGRAVTKAQLRPAAEAIAQVVEALGRMPSWFPAVPDVGGDGALVTLDQGSLNGSVSIQGLFTASGSNGWVHYIYSAYSDEEGEIVSGGVMVSTGDDASVVRIDLYDFTYTLDDDVHRYNGFLIVTGNSISEIRGELEVSDLKSGVDAFMQDIRLTPAGGSGFELVGSSAGYQLEGKLAYDDRIETVSGGFSATFQADVTTTIPLDFTDHDDNDLTPPRVTGGAVLKLASDNDILVDWINHDFAAGIILEGGKTWSRRIEIGPRTAVSDGYDDVTSPSAVAIAHPGTFSVGSDVQLDGRLGLAGDSDAVTHQWSIDTAPQGSNATISNPASPRASFVPDVAGAYLIGLNSTNGTETSYDAIYMEVAETGSEGYSPLGKIDVYRDGITSFNVNIDARMYYSEAQEESTVAINDVWYYSGDNFFTHEIDAGTEALSWHTGITGIYTSAVIDHKGAGAADGINVYWNPDAITFNSGELFLEVFRFRSPNADPDGSSSAEYPTAVYDIVDINNDGNKDLLLSPPNQSFSNTWPDKVPPGFYVAYGNGISFGDVEPVSNAESWDSFRSIDINGDDHLDIVLSRGCGFETLMSQFDGSLSDTPQTTAVPVDCNWRDSADPTDSWVGDLHADGGISLVALDGDLDGLLIIPINTDGSFGTIDEMPDLMNSPSEIYTERVLGVQDMNQDNRLDIVVMNRDSAGVKVYVFEQQSDESFALATTIDIGDHSFQHAEFGDWDGDGFGDMIVGHRGGKVVVISSTSSGAAVSLELDMSTGSGMADIDGDGIDEYLIPTRGIFLSSNDSVEGYEESELRTYDSYKLGINLKAVDYNDDGKLDLTSMDGRLNVWIHE